MALSSSTVTSAFESVIVSVPVFRRSMSIDKQNQVQSSL
jgi:hypothetical protein